MQDPPVRATRRMRRGAPDTPHEEIPMNPQTRTLDPNPRPPAPSTAPDLAAIKSRQQATWAAGDFGVIGTRLQIAGESLCEAVDVRGGERLLDVACGNGNAALAAARRWAEVTGIDYVPALVAWGRERAAADRLPVEFLEGDAENLPFEDGGFDVVTSVYGVMFTADHARAARELLRVCRPGGRIALANWTPAGFIGEMLRRVTRHVPPPPGAPSPLVWGTREGIEGLFGAGAAFVRTQPRDYVFRYRSARHFVDVFRTCYGPTVKAFEALDEPGRAALELDLLDLLESYNRSGDDTLVVSGEYLEVIIQKR
jgi:SAM-dependent methyltransferase